VPEIEAVKPEKLGSPCPAVLPAESRTRPARAIGAEQDETGADVASPCINVCKIDAASGLCEGCQRTLEEIAVWSSLSAAQKRALLARLPSRKRAQ
jgi:predicted Fe-S protein YdhL (DUF1289 family)